MEVWTRVIAFCRLMARLSILQISLPASAETQSLRVFDVDVFLTGTPPCLSSVTAKQLQFIVAPFSPNVAIEQIIAEVARRTAEIGSNTAYSIRILSAAPGQGFEVTALASTCNATSPRKGNDVLADAVANATSAWAYKISGGPPDQAGSSVGKATTQLIGRLSSVDLLQLKGMIVALMGKADNGIRPSCPFKPSLAFLVSDATNSRWWLVSNSCQLAMFVGVDDEWRRASTIVLSSGDLAIFERLSGLSR